MKFQSISLIILVVSIILEGIFLFIDIYISLVITGFSLGIIVSRFIEDILKNNDN